MSVKLEGQQHYMKYLIKDIMKDSFEEIKSFITDPNHKPEPVQDNFMERSSPPKDFATDHGNADLEFNHSINNDSDVESI